MARLALKSRSNYHEESAAGRQQKQVSGHFLRIIGSSPFCRAFLAWRHGASYLTVRPNLDRRDGELKMGWTKPPAGLVGLWVLNARLVSQGAKPEEFRHVTMAVIVATGQPSD